MSSEILKVFPIDCKLLCKMCRKVPMTKHPNILLDKYEEGKYYCENCWTLKMFKYNLINFYKLKLSKEVLLSKIPYFCKYYKDGCREILLKDGSGIQHEKDCDFRIVFCPEKKCPKNGIVIQNEMAEHITRFHRPEKKEGFFDKKGTYFGILKFVHRTLPIITFTLKFENRTFYYVGVVRNQFACIWIYILGSSTEANNFTYSITLGLNEDVKFKGQVYSMDLSCKKIIKSKPILVVSTSQLVKMKNESSDSTIPIKITLKNKDLNSRSRISYWYEKHYEYI